MAEIACAAPRDLPVGPIGRAGLGWWGVASLVASERMDAWAPQNTARRTVEMAAPVDELTPWVTRVESWMMTPLYSPSAPV